MPSPPVVFRSPAKITGCSTSLIWESSASICLVRHSGLHLFPGERLITVANPDGKSGILTSAMMAMAPTQPHFSFDSLQENLVGGKTLALFEFGDF